ncbi:hypothetical protein DPMN_173860 [Dreissena polymorpha]|uniref:Uncharacterized protein n=1 Tax=Dreissena polymorpha TaxID=45954 RepID=A0A9D4IFX0_DREPO|nr:hypothetical protein DPMN_173860 [Dreissena polymorpha]
MYRKQRLEPPELLRITLSHRGDEIFRWPTTTVDPTLHQYYADQRGSAAHHNGSLVMSLRELNLLIE